MTSCHCDCVDDFLIRKDTVNWYVLLQQTISEVNFLSDASSVDLDLHNMSFLLSINLLFISFMVSLLHVSVADDSDD